MLLVGTFSNVVTWSCTWICLSVFSDCETVSVYYVCWMDQLLRGFMLGCFCAAGKNVFLYVLLVLFALPFLPLRRHERRRAVRHRYMGFSWMCMWRWLWVCVCVCLCVRERGVVLVTGDGNSCHPFCFRGQAKRGPFQRKPGAHQP